MLDDLLLFLLLLLMIHKKIILDDRILNWICQRTGFDLFQFELIHRIRYPRGWTNKNGQQSSYLIRISISCSSLVNSALVTMTEAQSNLMAASGLKSNFLNSRMEKPQFDVMDTVRSVTLVIQFVMGWWLISTLYCFWNKRQEHF